MGAVERQGNGQVKNKKKNGITKNFVGKKNGQRSFPPFNTSNSYPPYSQGMRPRPPFAPGRMPPPGMGPVRMPPGPPPPLFRTRVPPPRGMGPRALMPGPPPMPMRPRPMGMPPMRPPPPPPPLMRPPPPMMGRFGPRGPPLMFPPGKMRQLKKGTKPGKKSPKKKQNTQNQYDMSSPWVGEELRTEFSRKNELLAKAKAAPDATKNEDWNAFKAQRLRCEKMYKAAKMEYIGRHPEEILEESSSEDDSQDEQSENFCDTCERAFYSHEQLQRHLQEHRECGIDGCTFVAHAKVVEKHIEMQHITGLYYRIKKTETPEDIAKWIQERKRKYPSKENIEKRRMEQQEMLKRGERIPKPNNRFGRKNKKVLGNPEFPYRKKIQSADRLKRIQKGKKLPTVSLVTSKDSWNGNLPPFGGTSELYESEVQELDAQINDDEWMSEKNEKVQITLNNALGALIGAYRSSDESDEDIIVPKNNVPNTANIQADNVNNDIKAELEYEKPEEVKIQREEVTELSNATKVYNNEKNFRKRKRNHKNKQTEPRNTKEQSKNVENKKPVVKHRKITLLERLLEPEIRHERNVILQCIRYVVQNNFFDKLVSVPDTDVQNVEHVDKELEETQV